MRDMKPEVAVKGENGVREEDLLVHDAHGESVAQAYMLASLAPPDFPTALGIFRQEEKPTYDDLLMEQIDDAIVKKGHGELSKLLSAGTTWLVD
jgi:2-oxoglutarate/2-oxoacid ferredoxin oxidoreductase subunit beta